MLREKLCVWDEMKEGLGNSKIKHNEVRIPLEMLAFFIRQIFCIDIKLMQCPATLTSPK